MTGCKCELRYSAFSFWCCINRLYHDFIVKNGEKRVAPQHHCYWCVIEKNNTLQIKTIQLIKSLFKISTRFLYSRYFQRYKVLSVEKFTKSSKYSTTAIGLWRCRLTKTVRWFVGLTSETKTTRKYQPTDNNDRLD